MPSSGPSGMAVLGLIAVVVVSFFVVLLGRVRGVREARETPIVVVAPLENRTGDPGFDLVGAMVTDWVTQALTRTGLVRVVDTRTILTAGEEPRRLATRARATYMVEGSVYRDGDSLRFVTQIVSPSSGEVRAVGQVSAAPLSPTAALEPLTQRLLGVLAVLVDDRLNNPAAQGSQPPTWEAYQEFLLGMRDFGQDFRRDHERFSRAMALDSGYWQARLWAGNALTNLRRYPEADSLFRSLESRRELLGPYDRANLDYFYGGFVRGDWETSYRGARMMVEVSPTAGHALWALGLTARMTRRPHEALDALGRINLEVGWGRDWAVRVLLEIARAHHILGNHAAELTAARRMVAVEPDAGWVRAAEARALAAAGRYGELAERVEAAVVLPDTPRSWEPFSGGDLLLQVGRELLAHGVRDSARRYLEAAVAWYGPTPAAGVTDTVHLLGRARALYTAGRWDEASALYRRLAATNPDSPEFLAGVGLTAARQGDTATAIMVSDQLAGFPSAYAFGRPALWRGYLAAAMGRSDEAVRHFAEALRGGFVRHYQFHSDPDLQALLQHPGFRALIRPRDGRG